MQVHQADQAWHPSLMHSFVGYGSIREPYPPAAKVSFYADIRGCQTLILHLHPWRQELRTHTQTHTHIHTHTHTWKLSLRGVASCDVTIYNSRYVCTPPWGCLR